MPRKSKLAWIEIILIDNEAVFRCIDYALRWIQAKRATGRVTETDKANLSHIQEILDTIPAELISQRAIDCNEYARALFHLEQHAQKMEQRKREPGERTHLLETLQDIYANIDEPDGLDGISAHLHDLDINQQILSHRKAGRWTAVQSWYEMQLTEKPDNVDVQVDLLNCLKQAGQHGKNEAILGDCHLTTYRRTLEPYRRHAHRRIDRQEDHALRRGGCLGHRKMGKPIKVYQAVP